jgi:hypothetical protein
MDYSILFSSDTEKVSGLLLSEEMKQALERRRAAHAEAKLQTLEKVLETYEKQVTQRVGDLRSLRRAEREQAEGLKRLNDSKRYAEETGNTIPLLKETVYRYSDYINGMTVEEFKTEVEKFEQWRQAQT